MSGRNDVKRRLAALSKAINPAGSLGAKLKQLTDEERNEYQRHQQRLIAWAGQSDRNLYERMLEGDTGPQLRSDLQIALFGPTPTIPADATDEEAAQIYQISLQKDK